jgi:biopolymer transport protein TolQ
MPSTLAQSLHHLIPLLAGLGTAIQILVLAALLIASIVCWSLMWRKVVLFRRVRTQTRRFLDSLRGSDDLAYVAAAASHLSFSPQACMFYAMHEQLGALIHQHRMMLDHVGGKAVTLLSDHLRHLAHQCQTDELRRCEQGLSFLATTAGAAPFVGLLGTVWGIMQSFHAIGNRGGATLAVVGPGISEALVATAAGLAVAIPALVAYNVFVNRVRQLETDLDHFAEELTLLFESHLIQRVEHSHGG